ncbi:MAG TPA: response regulator, partial [Bacteroidales bacterium]|nr:response regulator [Bacteroidales bacterium]
MRSVSVVVVDDEQPACDRLSNLLAKFKEVEPLGSFTDSLKAVEFIKRKYPDIVFLDVELENGISAFDIITKIRDEADKSPHFVIVTA